MKQAMVFFWLTFCVIFLCSCTPNPNDTGSRTLIPSGENEVPVITGTEKVVEGENIEEPEEGDGLSAYKIRSGDILQIDGGVFSKELNRQVRVDDKGFVRLRYIDRVKVGGLTKWEAEDEITELYRPFFRAVQITVEVLNLRFYIGGEVRNPGPKPYDSKLTLTQAITVAQGFQPFANKRNVMIKRVDDDGESVVIKYNIERIEKGEAKDPYIRPNDQIIVPR